MSHEAWIQKLDQYLDGELAAPEMQEMDRHLGECAPCAAEALRRVQWKRATKLAGQRYTPSAALRERVQKRVAGKTPGRSWRWWPAFAAVAAVALVALGLFTVQQNAQRVRANQIAGEIADLHVATLASANPVDVVSTDRHTVKPWFAGKIPFSFNIPELQGTSFELVGGRVAYLEQAPGAQLIFRVRKHQISAFVFQERAIANFRPVDAHSFQFVSWEQGELRYFLIGDASPEDLRELESLLRR